MSSNPLLNKVNLSLEHEPDKPLSDETPINLDVFDYKIAMLLADFSKTNENVDDSEYITEREYAQVMHDIFPIGTIIMGESPLKINGISWKKLNAEDNKANDGLALLSGGSEDLEKIQKGEIQDHEHFEFTNENTGNDIQKDITTFNALKVKVSNPQVMDFEIDNSSNSTRNYSSGFKTNFWIVDEHNDPSFNFYVDLNSSNDDCGCRPMPTDEEIDRIQDIIDGVLSGNQSDTGGDQ